MAPVELHAVFPAGRQPSGASAREVLAVSLNSQGDYQDVSLHSAGAINTRSAVSVVYLLNHSLNLFALTLAEHVRTRSFHFGRQNTAGRIGSRARSTLHIRCLAPLISDAVGLDGACTASVDFSEAKMNAALRFLPSADI
jgi:hypothetical protein